MKTIVALVLVIFCLPGLLQVANGTKSPSQFTDETTTNVFVPLIEHEAVLIPIDTFWHSILK
jgi:hypothetical protein